MEEKTNLAQEISAEVQVSVPLLGKRISSKRRQYQEILKKLKSIDALRYLNNEVSPSEYLATGVSSTSRTIPFGSHYLFGVAAVSQLVAVSSTKLKAESEDAAFHIDFVTLPAWKRRVQWKRLLAALQVTKRAITQNPDLIVIDFPLTYSRGIQTTMNLPEVDNEWVEFLRLYEEFWKESVEHLYPFNKKGTKLISISSKLSHGLLKSFISSDEIQQPLSTCVELELDQVSGSFLIYSLVDSSSRTIPIKTHTESDQFLSSYSSGFSVLYSRSSKASRVMQIEIPGKPNQWGDDTLDDLCKMVFSLTMNSNTKGLPYPLWLAKEKSSFGKRVLRYASQRIRMEMSENE